MRLGVCILLLFISTKCIGENIDTSQQELQRLIQSVLPNNFDLQIKQHRVDITQFNKNISHEEFFPSIGMGISHQNANIPANTIYNGSLTGSVNNQALEINPYIDWQSPYLGTYLRLGFLSRHEVSNNTNYLFKPYYRTQLSATIRQPLLKDFWINPKLKRIKDEEINLKVEKQSQTISQLDTVFQLEQSYWTLRRLYIQKALLSELWLEYINCQKMGHDHKALLDDTQKQHLLNITKFYDNDQPNSYIPVSLKFRQNEIDNILRKLNSDNDNIRNLYGFLNNLNSKTQASSTLQHKIKNIDNNHIIITQLKKISSLLKDTTSKNYQDQLRVMQEYLSSEQLQKAVDSYQPPFFIRENIKQFLRAYSQKTFNAEQKTLNQLKNLNLGLLDYEIRILTEELIGSLQDNDNILYLPRIAKLRTLKHNIERLIPNSPSQNTTQKKLLAIIHAFTPQNKQQNMIVKVTNLIEELPDLNKYSSKDMKNKLLGLQNKIAQDIHNFDLLEPMGNNIYKNFESQYISLRSDDNNTCPRSSQDNKKYWMKGKDKVQASSKNQLDNLLLGLYKNNSKHWQHTLTTLKAKLQRIQVILDRYPGYILAVKENTINHKIKYNIQILPASTKKILGHNTAIYDFSMLNEEIGEIIKQIDEPIIQTENSDVYNKKLYRDTIDLKFQTLLNYLDKPKLKRVLISLNYHDNIDFSSPAKPKELALYPSLYQDIEDIRLVKKQITILNKMWNRAAQDKNVFLSSKARLLEMKTRMKGINRDIANVDRNIIRTQNALIAITQNTGTLQNSFVNPVNKLKQIGLNNSYQCKINTDIDTDYITSNTNCAAFNTDFDLSADQKHISNVISEYQHIPELSGGIAINYKEIMETVLGHPINTTSNESIDDIIGSTLIQTLPQFKEINLKVKQRKLEKQYVLNQNLPQIDLMAQYLVQGQAGRAVNGIQRSYVIDRYYGGYSDSFDNLLSNDLNTLKIGITGSWLIRPPSIMFDKVRKQDKQLLILQTKREKALVYTTQQLRYAYTEFETAYDQYQFASEQIKILQDHVEIQKEIYENKPNASLQDLLLYYDRIRNFYIAQISKVQAIENYQKAYAKLYRLSGLSLKRYNISTI